MALQPGPVLPKPVLPKPNASDCHAFCTTPCDFYDLCPAPPPPPPPLLVAAAGDDSGSSSVSIRLHKSSHLVPVVPIAAASFVAGAFLLLLALFALISLRRRRLLQNAAAAPALAPADGGGGGFFDDDGDMVDHHIWYIRTAGLDESTIGAITAWAYKAGDGILDSSSADCAVCLAEFRDGELLRLLPKCGHAFHLSCIDSWLRSHTRCPLCRAPIVASKSTASSGGGGHGPCPPSSSQSSSAANQLNPDLSSASLIDGNRVVNWPSDAGRQRSGMEVDGESLEPRVRNVMVITTTPNSGLQMAIRRSPSVDSLPIALELGERSNDKANLEEERVHKDSRKQGNDSKGHARTRSSILPM